ncbi:MAG TPA: hypothetical protein VF527_07285 [Pyrinomonadaceae bacterium]|jgi:hypothetical protein
MSKYKILSRQGQTFLIITFVIIFIVALGVSGWSSGRKYQQSDKVHLARKTHALSIFSATINEDSIKLALKNESDKKINGFQITVNELRVQVEFLDADEPARQVLHPGAIYEQWYQFHPTSKTPEISIQAVVFEDGSSDGDTNMIREIKETRLGQKMQLQHFIPSLKKALKAPDADTIAVLDRLESEILSLEENQSDNLSGNIKLGIHNEKTRILGMIQQLRRTQQTRGSVQIKKVLVDFQEKAEKKQSKL